MKRILKSLLIFLMIIGITLTILNFVSIDNMAKGEPEAGSTTGTLQSNGDCLGDPLNC